MYTGEKTIINNMNNFKMTVHFTPSSWSSSSSDPSLSEEAATTLVRAEVMSQMYVCFMWSGVCCARRVLPVGTTASTLRQASYF